MGCQIGVATHFRHGNGFAKRQVVGVALARRHIRFGHGDAILLRICGGAIGELAELRMSAM